MKRHLQCAEQQLSSTNVTMQLLCLPRKMTRIIDPRDIRNVIYNARSNRTNLPTSPNMAPATKNGSPKSKRNLLKTVEASFTMRGRFDHDPNPNSSSRTRPFAEVTFRASGTHFVVKITTFRAPAIYPLISPNNSPAAKSDIATSPNIVPATKSDIATVPNTAPATKSDELLLY